MTLSRRRFVGVTALVAGAVAVGVYPRRRRSAGMRIVPPAGLVPGPDGVWRFTWRPQEVRGVLAEGRGGVLGVRRLEPGEVMRSDSGRQA